MGPSGSLTESRTPYPSVPRRDGTRSVQRQLRVCRRLLAGYRPSRRAGGPASWEIQDGADIHQAPPRPRDHPPAAPVEYDPDRATRERP